MKIALIGSPESGKDDLFFVLSEGKTSKIKNELIGTAIVKDERVEKLSKAFNPKKTTYIQINFISPDFTQSLPIEELRISDEIVYVVKCYSSYEGENIDPLKTLSDIDLSFKINDIEIIENYISKHKKEPDSEKEVSILEKLKTDIEENKFIKDTEILKNSIIKGLGLISLKPKLIVLNISEDMISGNPYYEKLKKEFPNYEFINISVELEKELLSLNEDERSELLKAYGIAESGLNLFVKSSYKLLDLITFFTVGEDEVRAWTLRKNSTAFDAAGKIHSDIQRGFIKAEVINYEDFLKLNFSFKEAKDKGLLRLEGKDYIVQDGDIVHIRFHV